jgi:hypothetical protein
MKTVRRHPRHLEWSQQCALFAWAAKVSQVVPELAWLYHCPNGGSRGSLKTVVTRKGPVTFSMEAKRLKMAGAKAGVPDLHLPLARMGHHGMWIEMKAAGGVVSDEQASWMAMLRDEHHKVIVCYNWSDAAHELLVYLGRQPVEFGL